MARHRTREERAELVEAYRASGVSAYRFTKDQGLGAGTLARWICDAAEHRPAAPSGFVRLAVAPDPRRPSLVVEIGGARIEVPRGFDAALLSEIVSALGARG